MITDDDWRDAERNIWVSEQGAVRVWAHFIFEWGQHGGDFSCLLELAMAFIRHVDDKPVIDWPRVRTHYEGMMQERWERYRGGVPSAPLH